MRTLTPAVLASLAALSSLPLAVDAGCGSSSSTCAPEGTVTVTVTNQVDSDTNFVCNAQVTITPRSGGAAQTLTAQGLDGSMANCLYVVNVVPGSYVLTATAEGYQTGTSTITIQQTSCVTASSMFSIPLIPIGGGPMTGDASADDGSVDDDADVIRDGAVEDAG